jgi:hypothetical protein
LGASSKAKGKQKAEPEPEPEHEDAGTPLSALFEGDKAEIQVSEIAVICNIIFLAS